MIHHDTTSLIWRNRQRTTHVWVTCDWCGDGRWLTPSNAKRLPEGHPCHSCASKQAWDGKRVDLSDGKKACSSCGEYKPLSEFAQDKRKRGGVRSYCLECSAKRTKEYREKDPERSRAMRRVAQANRRARKHAARGEFSIEIWERILDTYGHKCLCCGATEDLQPDHIVPLSKGGAHDAGNIQPLCGFCNRRKQADIIDYR